MPKKIFTEQEKEEIIRLYTITKIGAKPLAAKYGCSAPTLLKNLAEWGVQPNTKKLDLTNQYFGKLQAIKPAPKRNDRYTRWVCKCECGNEIEVRTDYLTSLHTTSCGCEKAKYFNKTVVLNQAYGLLTPLAYDEIQQKYLCKCECGNQVYVKGYNLNNGNTQSCGCLKSKGELKINQLLSALGMQYQTQYSFNDCRFPDTNRLAYFDYAIFNNNELICLIEYDGTQHQYGWNQNEISLQKIQIHDKIKDNYCLIHNIPLIRIPCSDYDKLTIDYLKNIIKDTADAPDMEEAQEVAESDE